jgi:biotin carboxylase
VKAGFKSARSRGEALFKDPGAFIERFYPESHHVEVQIFGNGQGKAVHFGEREVCPLADLEELGQTDNCRSSAPSSEEIRK